MIMTRSCNGSRNPSRGASPVRHGGDDDGSGDDDDRSICVLGCRRHPLLRRSLLPSPISLPMVGL